MKYRNLGSAYNVSVSRVEVEKFKRSYPCSGLPDRAITFQFDVRNGDLLDIWPDSTKFDGPGLLALSQDAQAYGVECIDRNERLQRMDVVHNAHLREEFLASRAPFADMPESPKRDRALEAWRKS